MLILLTVIGIAILLICFWPQIRSLLTQTVLPWIKRNWGEKFFNPLVKVTDWLDGKIRGIRRGFNQCVRFIKERILNMKTTIVRVPSGEIINETATDIKNNNGDIVRITTRKPVDFNSLSQDIQAAILQQMPDKDGNRRAQSDDKQLLMAKIKERAKEDKKLAPSQEEEAETEEILEMAK